MSCFLGNEDPIEYPCDFPIKIMGERKDEFAGTIVEVIRVHDPLFDAASLDMRLSSKGNYLSLTAGNRCLANDEYRNDFGAAAGAGILCACFPEND